VLVAERKIMRSEEGRKNQSLIDVDDLGIVCVEVKRRG